MDPKLILVEKLPNPFSMMKIGYLKQLFGVYMISSSGFFLEVSGQVKEWFILEMHKTIKMAHVVVSLMFFIVLCDRGWQGEVLKLMKNDIFRNF